MNIVPSNEYLLVMPSGNVKGFDDYAMAKAYIKGDIIETPLENTAFIVGMLFNAK